MPPKTEKGRREAEEVAGFVLELYEHSPFESWGEFARASGVSAATMSDYKRAENAPSGYRLIRMIRAAGWPAQQPQDEGDFLERAEALLLEVRRRLHPPHQGHPNEPEAAGGAQ